MMDGADGIQGLDSGFIFGGTGIVKSLNGEVEYAIGFKRGSGETFG